MAAFPYPSDLEVSDDESYYINSLSIKDKWDESKFRERLRGNIAEKLRSMEHKYDPITDNLKEIQLGSGGVAMLYFHLANTYASDDEALRNKYLEKSLEIIHGSLKEMKLNKIAFLHGPVGLFSLGAVVHNKLNHDAASLECVQSVLTQFDALFKKKVFPFGVLFGHAGYLHALLFINHYMPDAIPEKFIRQAVNRILEGGKTSKASKIKSPLSYTWQNKHYIGGAHGMAGIACQLLQVEPAIIYESLHLLEPFVSYLLTMQKNSGNFPSSLESVWKIENLVQFCHGAPGVLPLLALARSHKLLVDGLAKVTESAVNLTWSQGLLTQGHGLCHGISGNAYAFLSMYRHTRDPKYLAQARAFAEFTIKRWDTERVVDNPFSLYDGLAGNIYFLADMLNPMKSAFPGYEIPLDID